MLERALSSKPLTLGLAGVLLGLAAGLAFFFGLPSRSSVSIPPGLLAGLSAVPAAPEQGAPAPDFNLSDTQGRSHRLSDLQGSVVLINFWATWCAPCRIEMPALEDRYARYKEVGLQVLAVNFDEPLDAVTAFGESFGLSFPLLLDPGGHIQQLYRVRGYPSSYFVDREGVIRIVHIGLMTEGQLDGYLSELGIGP